jgi:LmbE family N-acetylglucosaminyl deacetylase
MKILYIFPHPDDESFGPAHAISKQRRQGHEVHLLTLTKGGATKQRHKYGYSVEEMGGVRYKEMLEVAKVLDLNSMTVLDLPDSGLKEMDPREIEKVVKAEVEKIKPDVIVTYAVHGISGFHDHLVSHAVVKRVYEELKNTNGCPKRLAFLTVTEEDAKKVELFKLNFSKPEEIDCIIETDESDIDNAMKALSCYKTYEEVIKNSNIRELLHKNVVFEIYKEKHEPKLKDLFEKLN